MRDGKLSDMLLESWLAHWCGKCGKCPTVRPQTCGRGELRKTAQGGVRCTAFTSESSML